MNAILPASVWAIWKTGVLQIILGVQSEWSGEMNHSLPILNMFLEEIEIILVWRNNQQIDPCMS